MNNSEQIQKAQLFRSLHERSDAFIIPNPWDAGTARLLTAAGLAYALGRRDGAATRAETLANSRDIVQATHLPVAADLENGFGDSPETVAETIHMAAAVGLVGGSIEDATGNADTPIYDFDASVKRVEAAVEAARGLDFPFMLAARAENFLHGRVDLPDTIRRLQAFEKAGADVLFAPGLPDLDAIRQVCAAVSRPVNVVSGTAYTLVQLAEVGVKRVSTGSALVRASLSAVAHAAEEMRAFGSFNFAKGTMSFSRANTLMMTNKLN